MEDAPQRISSPYKLPQRVLVNARHSSRERDALASLIRLALESHTFEEQLRRALDFITSRPWLNLKPGGCVYLVGPHPGRLDCKVRHGLAQTLMLSPAHVPDSPELWLAGPHEHPSTFARLDAFPEHAKTGHLVPRSVSIPMASGARRVGLLVLFADPKAPTTRRQKQFLTTVADILAGIIDRKLIEESLRVSEERYQLALSGTAAGIWDWDLNTNHVFFSQRWRSMLGYEDQEINNEFHEWESRLHPDDRARALDTVREYLMGGLPDYELEHRLRHKDGTYRWILARGAKVNDAKGNPARMVGSHLDITERKRTEEALRAREARLLAARRIQERLLPQRPPQIPAIELAAASRSAEFTGGDWFDFLPLPDGRLGVCIADVAGHGFDSSLLMATAAARIRSYLEFPLPIENLLQRVNQALLGEVDGEHFVTLTMLQIDPATGHVRYVNAGNPDGLVLDARGNLKTRLPSHSPPLAIDPDTPFTSGGAIRLNPGDVVILFTDGLLEARWPAGDLLKVDQIAQVVTDRIGAPTQQILEVLFEHALAGAPSGQLLDDLTAVVLRYTG